MGHTPCLERKVSSLTPYISRFFRPLIRRPRNYSSVLIWWVTHPEELEAVNSPSVSVAQFIVRVLGFGRSWSLAGNEVCSLNSLLSSKQFSGLWKYK